MININCPCIYSFSGFIQNLYDLVETLLVNLAKADMFHFVHKEVYIFLPIL